VPSPRTSALFMASALALNLTPGPAILFIYRAHLARGELRPSFRCSGLSPHR